MLLDRHALALAALLLSMPLRVSAQEPRADVGVGAVIDELGARIAQVARVDAG